MSIDSSKERSTVDWKIFVLKYFVCKVFVALHFCSTAHQRNFFNDHCVKN